MRSSFFNWLLVAVLMAFAIGPTSAASHASPANNTVATACAASGGNNASVPPLVTGWLSVDAPIFNAADRIVDRSPEFHGCLRLNRLIGPVSLVTGGDLCLRDDKRFYNENKLRVGLECADIIPNVTPYITWERRWGNLDDRWIGGVRWNFSSRG